MKLPDRQSTPSINLHSETLPRVDGKEHGQLDPIQLRGESLPRVSSNLMTVRFCGRRIPPNNKNYRD